MKYIFVVLIIFTLNSCVAIDAFIGQSLGYHIFYDGAPFVSYPERIFLISETKDCKFLGKIAPTSHMWKPGVTNLVQFELKRLQSMASVQGANSISNVVIKDANNPIGEADAYICPDEVYRQNADNQKDKVFFDKVVKVID